MVANVFVKGLGKVAGLAANPKAMAVINVVFYTSSALKAGCELVRSANTDFMIRQKAEETVEAITKDTLKGYLTDNRDELLKDILTDKEKEFLKKVSKAAKEAEKKAG